MTRVRLHREDQGSGARGERWDCFGRTLLSVARRGLFQRVGHYEAADAQSEFWENTNSVFRLPVEGVAAPIRRISDSRDEDPFDHDAFAAWIRYP